MEEQVRAYPFFSACGLNCGLCPRHHTQGESRCPGCAGEGFSQKHPPCGVLSCCRRHGLEYCFECGEYPCGKYEGADAADSFITHKNQLTDNERAGQMGMAAYGAELNQKMAILQELLDGYDDGRRKGFYCLAVNLLAFSDLEEAVGRIRAQAGGGDTAKERAVMAAEVFRTMADERKIELKLRKREKA